MEDSVEAMHFLCVIENQCGQGQVKHHQAAKHVVNSLVCQSRCHGNDVTALLLGQVHMGFAMINFQRLTLLCFQEEVLVAWH